MQVTSNGPMLQSSSIGYASWKRKTSNMHYAISRMSKTSMQALTENYWHQLRWYTALEVRSICILAFQVRDWLGFTESLSLTFFDLLFECNPHLCHLPHAELILLYWRVFVSAAEDILLGKTDALASLPLFLHFISMQEPLKNNSCALAALLIWSLHVKKKWVLFSPKYRPRRKKLTMF